MKCQEALEQVFRQVFGAPNLRLRPDMTPTDIDGWDSLAHVNLIVAVEQHFKIKLDGKELRKLRTVGDLGQIIDGKLG
jgi:acyl carrier protein